ncbi:PQQ-binding-like beta-propeller repeat protein [Natronolimnobius sp. AArcel1]|uniref:outer membrane protein assembly factor BamB family protein n=1 Tax=Natronolimnobius sp. AArcel1 TaxID=1679093 RepID=UPI0013EC52FA|nr:PQQ-binding-like beta-propeller repeat protein [Natronolimnobius sp. AArcel1]NGM67438.1 PQQ-binding-like beta-propeller repeat protein [Natronolimnobius sp. AArcel1]
MKLRTVLGTGSMVLFAGCSLPVVDSETTSSDGTTSTDAEGTVLENCPLESTAWPCYRGNMAQTGRNHVSVEPPYDDTTIFEFSEPLSIPQRSTRVTPGVAVTEDAVCLTTLDWDHEPLAVDPTDGRLLWRFNHVLREQDEPIRTSEFQHTSTPLAVCDSVILQTKDRRCRIDILDGSTVWEDTTSIRGGALIGNRDTIYHPDSLCRIDPQTGSLDGCVHDSESGILYGFAVSDDYIVASSGYGAGRVIAYNTADWSLEWKEPTPSGIRGGPTIHNGRAFVSISQGTKALSIREAQLRAYDLETGTERWQTSVPDTVGAPSHDEDGTVYLPHTDDVVHGYDETDGEQVWSANIEDSLEDFVGDPSTCYPPLITDETMILAGRDGIVIVDRDDGSHRWSAAQTIVGAPAVTADGLFLATRDGVTVVR